MQITDYIGTGKGNAVTRAELVNKLNLPDRTIRNLIEEERRKGTLIINAGDGAGYYISDSLDDLVRQYRTNHNRAMSVLVQQKHLRRRIKELGGEVPCRNHKKTRKQENEK